MKNTTLKEHTIMEIIKALFENDYKYFMRVRLMILGNAIAMLVMSAMMILGVFFVPFSPGDLMGMMYIFIVFFISIIFYAIAQNYISFFVRTKILGAGTYKIYTVLLCPKCKKTKIRFYKGNEYVGMKTNETCPNCGEKMIIASIFGDPERKIKSVGIPIGLGGIARDFVYLFYSLLLKRIRLKYIKSERRYI